MSEFLKGNFETKNKVEVQEEIQAETLDERFEKEARKKLGGSIAYVAKQKVVWDFDND